MTIRRRSIDRVIHKNVLTGSISPAISGSDQTNIVPKSVFCAQVFCACDVNATAVSAIRNVKMYFMLFSLFKNELNDFVGMKPLEKSERLLFILRG